MNRKMRSIAYAVRIRLLAIALFVVMAVANACNHDRLGEGGVLKANALDARPLTPRQVVALNHLAFPQQAESMLARFGEPSARDGYADYYPLPDGGTAIVVYLGHRAQSVEVQ
jgi:hypothetical protein